MKIALLGYGKMGQTIEQLVLADKHQKHEIVLKIDKENAHTLSTELLQSTGTQVIIEFSTPHTVIKNIEIAFDANVPIVVGTTAWHEQLPMISQQCKDKNAILLYATNFSIGVNIFFALNKKLAKLMANQSEYQLQIDEIHHTQKLDSPSGTAITLAEAILENNLQKKQWVNEKSDKLENLTIISHRKEAIKGTHKITYSSPIDQIEISHIAHSREGFAKGAILAAEWLLQNNKSGIYTISDMLDLN